MESVYVEGWAALRPVIRSMQLDQVALARRVRPCELTKCHGTCCYDGVYLTSEERATILELADPGNRALHRVGLELDADPVVFGRFRDRCSGMKTAVKRVPMGESVKDYPAHFADTRCVLSLDDGRCALEALAVDEGRDRWFYKPFTCWMHPLSIPYRDGECWLTLHSPETDPQGYRDYPGFTSVTHCGRECPEGLPAYRVFERELTRLGEIGGRDLLGEIERDA